jgi:DNA (cytosine-5)-methyltransferase 1
MKETIKVASFFCGCGGSDLGIIGDFNFLNKNYSALDFEINYALDFTNIRETYVSTDILQYVRI